MRTPRPSRLVAPITAIAAAALLLPAAAATAAPLSYPAVVDEGVTVVAPFPNYELEIDCAAVTDQYEIDELGFYAELYHVPGGSLTLTFNCSFDPEFGFDVTDIANTEPTGSIDVESGDGVTVVTVEPNTNLDVNLPEPGAYFEVEYYLTTPLADPSGSLLHEVSAAVDPADVADFGSADDSPVYDCVDDGIKPYATQVFTVQSAGTYTFRLTDYLPYEGGLYYDYAPTGGGSPPNPWGTYNPFSDAAMVLYSSFNPASTDAGFIDCNDDSDAIDDLISADPFDGEVGARDSQNRFLDEYFPELVVTLQPGIYTLVIIPYEAEDDLVQVNDGAELSPTYIIDDLGALTTGFEIWGEPRGIVLGAQLSATGADTGAAWLLGGIAAAALGTGVVLLVVRRRVS